MNRVILKSLNAPLLVLVTILGVAVQTSLFASYPLMYLQPDIILIVVIWCAMRRNFTEGGILTLIFANIAEIHSSAPQGLYLIAYMSIYLLGRVTNRLLVIPNLSSLVFLTLCASILWKLEYLFVLYLLGDAENQWRHTLVLLLPGAVMEGVTAIWMYRWLEKFDRITFKQTRTQLEEDLYLEEEAL